MFQHEVKVCLIDDDPNFREIYSIALQREGFESCLANDGNSGLEMVRQQMPDIILLDINMPGKNGIEVLSELSGDLSLSNIPVVVLSNNDKEETIREVGDFDADFYLVKTLTTPQEVIGVIREVMELTA